MRKRLAIVIAVITVMTGLLAPASLAQGSVSPLKVKPQITGTSDQLCALNVDGEIKCWGPGATVADETNISILGRAVQISGGMLSMCALFVSGKVSCWGGSNSDVLSVPENLGQVSQVSVGALHACAIGENGLGICWGSAGGHGGNIVPEDLGPIVQISAGNYHTCALKINGDFRCWGDNYFGQWNNGGGFPAIKQWHTPGSFPAIRQLSAGGVNNCVLDIERKVNCWGGNHANQSDVPSDLGLVTQLAVGTVNACALQSSGSVRCWGANYWGQSDPPATKANDIFSSYGDMCLLDGAGHVECWGLVSTYVNAGVPTGLKLVGVSQISGSPSVATGNYHTCAIQNSGQVKCWGWNFYGQIITPGDLGPVTQISTGQYHTCAVTVAGVVRCWGANNAGRSDVPSDLGPATAVAAGDSHTCAITSSKNVRCWGSNDYGQLNVPTDLGQVSQITSGATHACALTVVDTVRCWGNNSNSEISVPGTLGEALEVKVGGFHTCAISSEKKVLCWGWNYFGQTDVPSDLGSVRSISTGLYDTCAVTLNGTARCWGYNGQGQTDIPENLGEVSQISAGGFHTCAITISKNLKCWGFNEYGQTQIPSDLRLLPELDLTTMPTINGKPNLGVELEANVGDWDSGVTFSYNWLRDGVEINGATKSKYMSIPSDVGHALSVRVIGSLDGYESTSLVSQPVTIATPLSEMGSKNWPRVASNSDGTKLAAIAGDHTIWTSSDSGLNWIQRTGAGITFTGEVLPSGTRSWQRVASSSDGTKLAAVVYNGSVWTSSDSGETWIERPASGARFWSDIASSADGTKLVALAYPGGVWTSTDSGLTWTERTNAGYRNWGAVASNADGTVIVASWNDGSISVSHDSGLNWSVSSIPSNFGWWRALASNADGTRLYGVEWCGGVWESKDSGSSWARNESFPTKTWYSIAVNADGSKIIAGSWAAECWGTPTDGKISLATSLNKFTQTGSATIQGGGYVGSVVKAQVGTYPTGTSFSYQWLRDGISVSGATDSQFVIRDQDYGHNISYQLTVTKSGYESSNLTSSSLEINKKGLTRLSSLVVSGKSAVGRVLSASISRSSGLSYSYQWLRDGVPIEGAVTRKYVLTASDANTTIAFRVCGTKQEFETACLVSNSSQVALGEMSRRPYVVMKWAAAKVGATIQGRPGNWDSDVSLSCSWLRDGALIPGENQGTYQISVADRGHSITFKVKAQKTGYYEVARVSASKFIR